MLDESSPRAGGLNVTALLDSSVVPRSRGCSRRPSVARSKGELRTCWCEPNTGALVRLESTRPRATGAHSTLFATGNADMTQGQLARLLDVVASRSGTVLAAWLDERDTDRKAQVTTASLGPFHGYTTALTRITGIRRTARHRADRLTNRAWQRFRHGLDNGDPTARSLRPGRSLRTHSLLPTPRPCLRPTGDHRRPRLPGARGGPTRPHLGRLKVGFPRPLRPPRRVQRTHRIPQGQEHRTNRPRMPTHRQLQAASIAQPRPNPRRSLRTTDQNPTALP